jgi:hypothetical protein
MWATKESTEEKHKRNCYESTELRKECCKQNFIVLYYAIFYDRHDQKIIIFFSMKYILDWDWLQLHFA